MQIKVCYIRVLYEAAGRPSDIGLTLWRGMSLGIKVKLCEIAAKAMEFTT